MSSYPTEHLLCAQHLDIMHGTHMAPALREFISWGERFQGEHWMTQHVMGSPGTAVGNGMSERSLKDKGSSDKQKLDRSKFKDKGNSRQRHRSRKTQNVAMPVVWRSH